MTRDFHSKSPYIGQNATETPEGRPCGRFAFFGRPMGNCDNPQLDPDDELDLYLMDIIDLLRCFGLRERAMIDVVSWRLSEIYPLVVSPTETAH